MLVLPLGVLCAIGYMLWLGRCFLNDCKANLPNEDYQRIAAEFGFIVFRRTRMRSEQWQYAAEESGEIWCSTAAHLARQYGACHRVAGGHGGAGFGWGKRSYKIMHSYIAGCGDLGAPCESE